MEVSIALAVFGLIVLLATRYSGASLFAPWSLYTMGQVLTLAVAYLKLDPLMTDFSVMTWMVWGGSAIAFYLGCAVGSLLPEGHQSGGRIVNQPAARLWLLGVLALYGYGLSVGFSRLGTWPMLGKNADFARLVFQAGAWTGQFQHACWVLLAVTPLFAVKSRGIFRLLACALFLVGFSYGILAGFRMAIMFGIISAMMTWEFHVQRVAVVKMVGIMALFLVASSLFVIQRTTGTLAGNNDLIKAGTEVLVDGAYGYVANNFWNLDYSVARQLGSHPHPLTFGGLVFLTPLVYVEIGGKLVASLGWDTWRNEGSLKYNVLNTISYQWTLIKECGWPGIILFPFGWGIGSAWLYRRAVRCRSEWAHLLYVPVGFSILFCFFLFMYITPMYWFIFGGYVSLWVLTRNVKTGKAST